MVSKTTQFLVVVASAVLLAGTTAQGQTTWYVDDDNCPGPGSGTPADPFCEILDGITAAVNDDTVQVADGTYTGTGNKNLDFGGRAITVRSENGPGNCIINCEGNGRGFYFHTGETAPSGVEGISVRNGSSINGAGIFCTNGSSPRIEGCVITGNYASNDGGGIYTSSGATVGHCTISGNRAGHFGGGLFGGCDPTRTILWGNGADGGEGPDYYANFQGCANFEDDECLDYWNCLGSAVDALSDTECMCMKGPGGSRGSRFVCDPLFSDPEGPENAPTIEGNYYLRPGSPCADDGGHVGQIGALGIDPALIPTLSEWGLIIMAVLLLAAGAVVLRTRRRTLTAS